eukprot:TRINITY_DN7308_c0_g1_i6.p1 TRINITY_DN7308_c0_g1~~TRINITY_DN7308_c0_g1_i6.p1  ORF type:complete len:144 (+),score=0.53 TRINITY_DN7308_c0_g1_i6:89-520(+)
MQSTSNKTKSYEKITTFTKLPLQQFNPRQTKPKVMKKSQHQYSTFKTIVLENCSNTLLFYYKISEVILFVSKKKQYQQPFYLAIMLLSSFDITKIRKKRQMKKKKPYICNVSNMPKIYNAGLDKQKILGAFFGQPDIIRRIKK